MLQPLKLLLAPPLWRLWCWSIKVPNLDPDLLHSSGPLIFACLHRDILGSILYVKPARPWLLVSGSDDGRILVRALGKDSFGFITGATGENGGRALVQLRRRLEQGQSIGLAVDGPKGPFGGIKDGVFQLAALTGATIVPLLPQFSSCWVLNTWDRTVVPNFFSGLEVTVGPLMRLGKGADDSERDRLRRQLELFFLPEEGARDEGH